MLKIKNIKKKAAMLLTVAFAVVISCVPVLASDFAGGASEVSTALNTAFSGICTDLIGLIVQILPVVLPILGAITLIKFGIRTFKSVTTKAS